MLVCASQELHDRFRAELWRIGNLGDKPRRIWDGAVVRWLKEKSHKATVKGDVAMLRWLDRFLSYADRLRVLRKLRPRIDAAPAPLRRLPGPVGAGRVRA